MWTPHECRYWDVATALFRRLIPATIALVAAFLRCDQGWSVGGHTMRLFPLFCSFVLLAGPACGQQLAITPAAKPECPPPEPDSIEISWNGPCDNGDWLFDTEKGCRMWDWHPDLKDRAVWSGACPAGKKQGRGVVQWFEHGQPIDRFEGTYRNNKREGFGHYRWTAETRYDGLYSNDVPNGPGKATVLGESFVGDWKNGCFVKGTRVVAIGVERTSCAGFAAELEHPGSASF